MKWKNKLKTVLAETAETKNSAICLEMSLTKADETQLKYSFVSFCQWSIERYSRKNEKYRSFPEMLKLQFRDGIYSK